MWKLIKLRKGLLSCPLLLCYELVQTPNEVTEGCAPFFTHPFNRTFLSLCAHCRRLLRCALMVVVTMLIVVDACMCVSPGLCLTGFIGTYIYKQIVGVSREATTREIKSAYRRLALELHPDKLGPNATEADHEKFIELAKAYEVLSDPQARAYYDKHGDDSASNGGRGGGPNFHAPKKYQTFDFDMFVRTKQAAFEFHWKQKTPPQPPAIGMDLILTLEEVYSGVHKAVNVTRQRFCPVCGGTGAHSHSDMDRCSACAGSGRHKFLRSHPAGYAHIVEAPCPVCDGTGKVIIKPCESCNGTRYIRDVAELPVNIAPGAPNGAQLPISGAGDQQLHHKPGDVVFLIRHAPHKRFRVEQNGVDLVHTISVPLVDALLGFRRNITTLSNETFMIDHSSVTFSGYRQAFPGHGLPKANANSGEETIGTLYVEVQVQFPTRLTPTQRALLHDVLDEDALAVLEGVIKLKNAGQAERSSKHLSEVDYRMSKSCWDDPFICPRHEVAELIEASKWIRGQRIDRS